MNANETVLYVPSGKNAGVLVAELRAVADTIETNPHLVGVHVPQAVEHNVIHLGHVLAPPRKWDVMLDLETWGIRPGCAIRSIGAVCFDPETDDTGPVFYTNVYGNANGVLTVDPETVKWWESQPAEARQALEGNPLHIAEAAQAFREWFHAVNGVNVWGHGAAFDPPVLEAASVAVGVKVPWGYRAVRDTRTLYALAEFDPSTMTNLGIPHHAFYDARFQAMCVQAATRKLRSPWGPVCGQKVMG